MESFKAPSRAVFCGVLMLALGASMSHGCWRPEDARVEDELPPLRTTTDCTPEMARTQFSKFMEVLMTHPHSSACADHWWLRDVAELKLRANEQQSLVVDVGCNKGYFGLTALNYLAHGYGNQAQRFFRSHLARGIYPRPCGACNECKQSEPVRPDGGVPGRRVGTVDVLCFEPSEIHVESLTRAREAVYGPPGAETAMARSAGTGAAGTGSGTYGAALARSSRISPTRVNFHIRQEGVSNFTGTARFPANCSVNTCSVGQSSGPNVAFTDVTADSAAAATVPVNMTTIDVEMAAMGETAFLDVLKIDTEGFDPAVLAGAYHSLLARRIGVLSFEYHHLWQRSGAKLRQCVSYLEALGYACYYDAAVLAKLSGSCWMDKYELHRWMNVVCAVSGSDMDDALLAGSYLRDGGGTTTTKTGLSSHSRPLHRRRGA